MRDHEEILAAQLRFQAAHLRQCVDAALALHEHWLYDRWSRVTTDLDQATSGRCRICGKAGRKLYCDTRLALTGGGSA